MVTRAQVLLLFRSSPGLRFFSSLNDFNIEHNLNTGLVCKVLNGVTQCTEDFVFISTFDYDIGPQARD